MEKIEKTDDEILFKTTYGRTFKIYHSQDCCESVRVESVKGDVLKLLASPITKAEETLLHNEDPEDMKGREKSPYSDESFTWTTFVFANAETEVTIRFYGNSNGYYSESVSFAETTPKPET